MSLLQPQLLPLDIGLGQQPILTSPYPIWLTAAQIGWLTVVSLISVVFALHNILAAWRRWRGGAISLGEDGNSSGKERLPPKNLKEAQDREIWDNVRAMVPERDEPIGLELFWRKAILRSAGLLLITLPSLWLIGGSIGAPLTPHEPWTLKLPIFAYILSTLIQIFLAWSSLRNQSDLSGYSKTIHQYLLIAMANFISQFSLVFGPSLVSAHTGRATWMSALPVYLALAQFVYSGCMPLGPRYRLDKRHLYNRGVRAALDKDTAPAAEYADAQEAEDAGHAPRTETFGVDSVTADASVSLFSWITMGWVPPVISAAARMSQVDVQHLPAVPHDLRSQEIAQQLHDGGHANQNEMASISSARLFWRLCLAQMGRIVPWFSLRVLAIPVDYLPHVALQMLLSSVEGGLRTDTALA